MSGAAANRRTSSAESTPMNIPRIVCFVILWLAGPVLADTVMYRFTNEQGDPVYSYTLPPGQAAQGYEKIDAETGRVLESVAPQLPPERLAEKQRRDQALKACRDELDRIYQLYGTENDIEYARREALESLDTRIGQLEANLRQARREQERLRSQAADAERAGRRIGQTLLDNIRRSQSQIDTLTREIEQRRAEQEVAEQRYGRELDRFRDGHCPEPEAMAAAP